MSKKSEESAEEAVETGGIDGDATFLKGFLKENKDHHFNYEEDQDYRVSTGSVIFDAHIDGGIRPGLTRLCGIFEGGKTSSALSILNNMLNSVPKSKGFYIKAEGRLSSDMKERSGVKFVYTPEDWVEGTCFVFECNIYEVAMEAIESLIDNNKDGYKYCFVLDSVDGLIPEGDKDKSFYDSMKVAGGAVIAGVFSKKVSQKLSKRGHIALFISQVRASPKIDPYSKEPDKQIVSTGGNALLHFADYIFEFQSRYQKDLILKNPSDKKMDTKKNPPIGHWAKVVIKKSPNEITNQMIMYPIRYGRTGGRSIWVEKELVDLLLGWGYVKSKGAWVTVSEELLEATAAAGVEMNVRYNGSTKFFEGIESNPELVKFLIKFVHENILKQ